MKLNKVRIRNFRSIEDLTITFENSCQFLVGINEAGKTNVLRALRLLDPQVKVTAKDRRRPLEGEAFDGPKDVTFELNLTPAERKRFDKDALSNFLCRNPDTTQFCTYLSKDLSLVQYLAKHQVPVIWIDLVTLKRHFSGYEKAVAAVDVGWQKRKPDVVGIEVRMPDGNAKSIETFEYIYVPDFPELSPYVEPIEIDKISNFFTAQFKKTFDNQRPACVFWNYEEKYILPSSIGLSQFCDDPSTCIPLQQMFALADISDIKKAVEEQKALGVNPLRSLLERVAIRSTKHVKSIWKENKNIEIKLDLNGDSIDASIVDHFNRYDFFDRSDGFKRFISLLLVLSAQARTFKIKDSLILIDEAEIGLHPSGVRYLRDELIKISESNFVIASTHSIFMVDRQKIDRHLVVKKVKEVTEVKKIDLTNILEEEVVYNALNYSVFENLKPFNVIFEGWRDKRLFDLAISDKRCPEDASMKLKAVGQCHLQGVGDAGRVVPMLELADRSYLLVSDSDDAAMKAKARFHGTGPWLTYKDLGADPKVVLTSEDFVNSAPVNAVLKQLALKNEKSPLELNDDSKRKPRVNQIRSWLQSQLGLEGDELKETLNQIKDGIFSSLKASHIHDEYFAVLAKISAKVPD